MKQLLFAAVALAGLLGMPAAGQNFALRYVVNGTAISVAPGASIDFPAPRVGASVVGRITATYTGQGSITIGSQPQVFGSAGFSITSLTLPVNLSPGQSFDVNITYRATATARSLGQFVFAYTEAVTPTTQGGPTQIAGSVNVGLAGTAPEFRLSYILADDQNNVAVPPGGKILFPDTLLGSGSTASLRIVNTGSSVGAVNGITMSGTGFGISGLPLFPLLLDTNQEMRVTLIFRPSTAGTLGGQLSVDSSLGPINISLEGQGIESQFTYQLITGTTTQPLSPGGSIPFGEVRVGETTSVAVRVVNSGTGSGTLSGSSILGSVFTVADGPALPRTIIPGASATFIISFNPTQPGSARGRLRLGEDLFDLSGTGLGGQLSFSYSLGSLPPVSLASGGSIVFPPTLIGESATAEFLVTNSGTLPVTVSNIGVATQRTSFTIAGAPPAFPREIQPSESLRLAIRFAPQDSGFLTGSLRVDALSFTLLGSGSEPPALPDYTITGPSGNVAPAQQASLGLELAAAYPLPLTGTLNITLASDAGVDDPAVQFATGGKSVSFTIPANTTRAVFSNGTQAIRVQTGTVAGNITVTPSFSIGTGSSPGTPPVLRTLTMTVPAAAPTLFNARVASRTDTGFVLQVTGATTTRSLTRAELTFTPDPRVDLPEPKLTLNVEADSAFWFRGNSSQSFGGQFTITITVNLSGNNLPPELTPINTVTGVAVVLSNERGASQPLQVVLQR